MSTPLAIRAYRGIPQPLGFNIDSTKVFIRESFAVEKDLWEEFSVLDIATGDEPKRLFDRGAPRAVRGLSPNGRWLVTAESKSASLELWDVSPSQKIGNLEDSVDGGKFAFSPDSRWFVASISADGHNRGTKSCRLLVWAVESPAAIPMLACA